MKTINQNILLITAAGSSTRIGGGIKKEFMQYNGGTVLSASAKTFLKTCPISLIVITIPENQIGFARNLLYNDKEFSNLSKDIPVEFTSGGATRQESVFNGLKTAENWCLVNKINTENTVIFIHDGARPFVSNQIIQDTLNATIKYGAAAPGIASVDTLKQITQEKNISTHLDRKSIICIQTPQAFMLDKILKCHRLAAQKKMECTDDTEIFDLFSKATNGSKVKIIQGSEQNIKITYKKDLDKLEAKTKMTRCGFGTDLHKLVEGRDFYLGGIKIQSPLGEEAHSDGDVLLHAVTDALLGAAGLGDIGSYFPPSDSKWKDASSAGLLQICWKDIKDQGWELGNLDCVVETEVPKILPWRNEIIDSIAKILNVEADRVFVKAKTNEGMDSVGQKLAVKAYCMCLLNKE